MPSYEQTIDFLFHALPAYHRVGAAAYKANLDNTELLMEHLGHPETGFKTIHVGGTNGKGSVSHMLASTIQMQGLKVGLYTSPHLVDFRERIRINGEMIPQGKVVEYVDKNRSFFDKQFRCPDNTLGKLSFFEMTVGMAFDYFRNEKVDVAVIEVGMGGRLDSTNVITPMLSVITNIGLEHTQFLGDTLEKIAAEKAGIIKPNVPVVIGESMPETVKVFESKVKECGSDIFFADQRMSVQINNPTDQQIGKLIHVDVLFDGKPYLKDLSCQLTGNYQLKNIATVCAAYEQLNKSMPVSEESLRLGLEHVIDNTGLHGRWETVGEKPLVVCETAHNADGICELVKKLRGMQYRCLHIIYGCVNDKDYGKILEMLPKERVRYYFTRPSVERGLDEHILAQVAKEHNINGEVFPDVAAALAAARSAADREEDIVLVTGSIFLVADLLSNCNNSKK